MGAALRFCEALHMKLNNPFAQPDMDIQDIKGGHYGLMNPALNILRAEGLACLLLACVLYQLQGFSWLAFAAWFFLPDVAILVYVLGNERDGMLAYNLTHSTLGAVLFAVLGLLLDVTMLLQASLIWFAHIGFDRALGFGLKFPLGFRVTHLGVLRGMREKV
jgi:cellulose synthase/poly-beta-1,6-N-acetylglucosamine synthase-like glycosyltransferase